MNPPYIKSITHIHFWLTSHDVGWCVYLHFFGFHKNFKFKFCTIYLVKVTSTDVYNIPTTITAAEAWAIEIRGHFEKQNEVGGCAHYIRGINTKIYSIMSTRIGDEKYSLNTDLNTRITYVCVYVYRNE